MTDPKAYAPLCRKLVENGFTCHLDTIRKMETVPVMLESGNSTNIVVNSEQAYFFKNNMTIPVHVISSNMTSESGNERELEGLISVEKSTLLSKLFEKSKPNL